MKELLNVLILEEWNSTQADKQVLWEILHHPRGQKVIAFYQTYPVPVSELFEVSSIELVVGSFRRGWAIFMVLDKLGLDTRVCVSASRFPVLC